jgi:hypothetical protein
MSMPDLLLNSAELALASYANLKKGPTGDSINLDALSPQIDPLSSLVQTTAFAARYPTVVTQYADTITGGMGTGFNATVFKDTAGLDTPGKLTLAIRGTDDLFGNDRTADSDIAFSSSGYDQVVAMVNWWARASAPATMTMSVLSGRGSP